MYSTLCSSTWSARNNTDTIGGIAFGERLVILARYEWLHHLPHPSGTGFGRALYTAFTSMPTSRGVANLQNKLMSGFTVGSMTGFQVGLRVYFGSLDLLGTLDLLSPSSSDGSLLSVFHFGRGRYLASAYVG